MIIGTVRKIEIFGKIEKSQPILSAIGLIVHECWMEIPRHFPNASLMDHIVMPDHLHGLIRLARRQSGIIGDGDSTKIENENGTGVKENGTMYRASTERKTESFGKPTKGSIPTIIRTYKAAVTRIVNRQFPKLSAFVWQPGYYEHIVRNREELKYTINYIKSNPKEWEADRIHKH